LRARTIEEAFSMKDAIAVVQPTADLGARDARPGRPSRAGGAAQLAWIDFACEAARTGAADALVTGPVSKEAIASSGAPGSRGFLGHTEHLARALASREVVMAFASEALTTALVTTHLPLAKVARAIRKDRVAAAAFHLAMLLDALRDGRRKRRGKPTVAVASLNPHAGEGGLLGQEERTAIAPGIALAQRRAQGIATIVGPVPAETAFRRALAKTYDGVVAMYHDQATIPMKCVAFGDAVNVTLGLPIVRTSVDHGTGYDIAGAGVADPEGMNAAVSLAAKLVLPGRR
jgi:4-hydroxythreonine-4-phosphate dehydrogenase